MKLRKQSGDAEPSPVSTAGVSFSLSVEQLKVLSIMANIGSGGNEENL